MKNIFKNYIIILIVLSGLIFTHCQKAKDGAPGKDGNANVSSIVYTVSTWSSNSSKYYTQLSVPAITADNINSVSVQVYFSTTANNWLAMPFTQVASTDYFMNYIVAINLVQVNWQYNGSISSGDDPNEYYGISASKFKVVVIPQALLKQYPNVDLNNYSQVKETFQLKD